MIFFQWSGSYRHFEIANDSRPVPNDFKNRNFKIIRDCGGVQRLDDSYCTKEDRCEWKAIPYERLECICHTSKCNDKIGSNTMEWIETGKPPISNKRKITSKHRHRSHTGTEFGHNSAKWNYEYFIQHTNNFLRREFSWTKL